MNFYKNYSSITISSVVAICISLIMVTLAIFVDKLTFTLPLLIKNWGMALLVISLTGMVFPLTDWSFALCRKMGLRPETLPHVLAENSVATLFFNITATIVLTAINAFHDPEIEVAVAVGFLPSTLTAFVQGVLHDWPIMFTISYIFVFFVTETAIRIAKQVMGELKSPHSPQNQFQ